MDARTAEQAMRQAIETMDPVDACHAVRQSHGLSFPQVADLYAIVTTGRPIPEWAKSGTVEAIHDPTGERRAWERGGEPR